MAYDEALADRIRNLLSVRSDVSERSMFGSLCFLVGGNLAVCARKHGELLVRLGQEDAERAVAEDGVRVAEMGPSRRVMKGWVFVSPERLADDAALGEWVEAGAGFASSLPPKD